MKKHLLGWFILVALLSFVIAGCGDDNATGNNDGNVPAELTGAWTFSSVTLDGSAQDLAEFFEWDASAVSAQVIISADFTQEYRELNNQNYVLWYDGGTFSIDGQNLTMIDTSQEGQTIDPDTTFSGTWEVNGNQATLIMSMDGSTIEITLTSVADVPDELLGTWTFQTITVDGTTTDIADIFEWDSTTVSSHIIIYADYTTRYEELDSDNSVVFYDKELFVINENSLTITAVSENGSPIEHQYAFSGSWSISGNQLTLSTSEEGHTIVFTLSK
ncbi:MAG: hypothetical protein DRP47_00915 [Candidatus Zixiibacteriota bacterium]|nr:MAG: hypothetical protein DRP47_00915 [candidate division Zixibacteria bacterium]